MAWNKPLSRRQNRIDSSRQNRHMERSICRATAHYYKGLSGSISVMLGDRKLLIAILRESFASTNINKKMTDPRGRVTLMDKKKRANSIAAIQAVKMTARGL